MEILIQGEEVPITNFLSLYWDGPKMTYVDDVIATESSSDSTLIEFKGFSRNTKISFRTISLIFVSFCKFKKISMLK